MKAGVSGEEAYSEDEFHARVKIAIKRALTHIQGITGIKCANEGRFLEIIKRMGVVDLEATGIRWRLPHPAESTSPANDRHTF